MGDVGQPAAPADRTHLLVFEATPPCIALQWEVPYVDLRKC